MIVLNVVLVVLAAALLATIVRILTGPTHADRALSVAFGLVVFTAGLAVLAVRLSTPALLDLVLAATLLGFLSTVAFAHLVERRAQ